MIYLLVKQAELKIPLKYYSTFNSNVKTVLLFASESWTEVNKYKGEK